VLLVVVAVDLEIKAVAQALRVIMMQDQVVLVVVVDGEVVVVHLGHQDKEMLAEMVMDLHQHHNLVEAVVVLEVLEELIQLQIQLVDLVVLDHLMFMRMVHQIQKLMLVVVGEEVMVLVVLVDQV
jgi:hypothetical protein